MKLYRIMRLSVSFFVAAMVMTCALAVLAADPQPAAPEEPATHDSAPTRTLAVNAAELAAKGQSPDTQSAAQPESKPMTLEIEAVLAKAVQDVAALQAEFDQNLDAAHGLELARQIETVKTAAELDVMRVQLKYARLEGHDDLAEQLDADLARMTTPRSRKDPIARPTSPVGRR